MMVKFNVEDATFNSVKYMTELAIFNPAVVATENATRKEVRVSELEYVNLFFPITECLDRIFNNIK